MTSHQRTSQHPFKHFDLTEKIIGCFYSVYHTLGYGFLEKVYENALSIELGQHDLKVVQQQPISVWYTGLIVGEYFADLVVNDLIIVEIKAVKVLSEEHEAQLLNYLKATPYEVGLLFNFGPKPDHKRRSFENMRKGWLTTPNPLLIAFIPRFRVRPRPFPSPHYKTIR